ncbi:cytochrome P450 [Astrocystis sublimbata]|nr:cytochrome P450 [Astrocystis sublimbata]
MGSWTTFDYSIFGRSTIDAVRSQYVTKLDQQLQPTSDELSHAFDETFTRYHDWTPVTVQPKILEILGRVVARTVAGPELCRDPCWVNDNLGYAQNVFILAVALKFAPSFIRPLIIVLTPYIYRIHRYRRKISRNISPHIAKRLHWRDHQPEVWAAHLKAVPMCTLDYLVKTSPPEESSLNTISRRLTAVSLGATHTTTNHVTNCIYDLAAGFESYAPPLRAEIEEILGPHPVSITKEDLSRMWKLDSFMKEVQRFYPPSKLSTNRKIMKPFKLSSGETIPQGTHISFAGVPMSLDNRQFENAMTFDPFRFERLRKFPRTDHSGLEFSSTYEGTMHFGHGNQSCPGRFMASMMSKLFIIELLHKYDLKLLEGEQRPSNIVMGDMDLPNPKYKILFRSRQTA